MDPRELAAYISGLLRGEAEIITAFLMGALLTTFLAYSLRRPKPPGGDHAHELARREAEIFRKDTELARKDAQVAGFEPRFAALEERLSGEERLVTALRRQNAALVDSLSEHDRATEQLAAMEASLAGSEAENHRLRRANQSLGEDAADLRTRLAQASREVEHWAKWWKVFDEENARLREAASLSGD